MKIKKNVVLRELAGDYMLIPVGEAVKENYGIFALTESGAMIFTGIRDGREKEEILAQILDEFEIDEETAKKDFDSFIEQMEKLDLM